MILRNGWWFPDADDFMWREMKNGGYQNDHLDAALAFVTDWSCAIDGGAHVGVWTKALAFRFQFVMAVEPAPDTFACLVENTGSLAKVERFPIALSALHGKASLHLDHKQAERKNTGGRFIKRNDTGDIRCESIDSWDLQMLGFLKLDIEGSEPMAIAGAAQTIRRCKPVVLFEDKGFCTRYGHARDASQVVLAALGYEHKARVGHDEIWTARA